VNTREDDEEQYQWLLKRRRDARRGIRWLRIMVYGACVVAVVLIAAGRAESAPAPADLWDEDCIWWPKPPLYSDGREIEASAMVGVRVERSASPAGPYEVLATVTQREYCYRPTVVGTNYYRLRTVMANGTVTEPGPVISAVTVAPPAPTMLLTVGGDVYLASPNYSNFSWKPAGVVGKIPPKVKCDPTRHIPPDLFRVTSPITWTAGKKNYVVARCEAV
jgi:hypothetical protein